MAAVDLREKPSKVKIFFDKYKFSFLGLLDTSGNVGARFGIRSIPTTFFLDRKGRIIGSAVGARQWDSQKSVNMFRYLIKNH